MRPLERDGPWRVVADNGGAHEDFDVVVNCLWNGRLAIDATAGLEPRPPWTHRFRLCVFLRTRTEHRLAERARRDRPVRRREELQRTGLLHLVVSGRARGRGLGARNSTAPPAPTGRRPRSSSLASAAPSNRSCRGSGEVFDDAESAVVHGGFVFALGRGAARRPAFRAASPRPVRGAADSARTSRSTPASTPPHRGSPRELANEIAGA